VKPDSSDIYYRRNLPHWQPKGAFIFLTLRLYGTLPSGTGTLACADDPRAQTILETPGRRFKRLDSQLDTMNVGPKWLAESRVAAAVESTIIRGDAELNQYELHGYVLMPNHTHLLIRPKVAIGRVTRGIKGVSANLANRILGRRGKAFWQDESFDHWVRNEREYGKIRFYIEYNPMTAGLVKKPEEWRWGSAWLQCSNGGAVTGAQAGVPVPHLKDEIEQA
jgi:putative transposase